MVMQSTRTVSESNHPFLAPAGTNESRPAQRKRELWTWRILIALVTLLAFQPAVYNTFNFDDVMQVEELKTPPTAGRWFSAWLEPWWPPSHEKAIWRPVTRVAILLEKAAFGSWQAPYYAMNVVAHLAVCLLLFETARLLGMAQWAAGAAALIFAAHGVHCEAVHQIVGFAEIMAAFWMLAGLNLYIFVGLGSVHTLWVQALVYALALGSKEHAIIYPAFLMLMTMSWPANAGQEARRWGCIRWPRRQNFWVLMIVLGMVLLLYFSGKYFVTDRLIEPASSVPEHENPLAAWPFLRRLPAALGIFGFALSRLAWPWGLSPDYSAISFPFSEGWRWAWSWAGAALLAVLVVWAIRNARRGGRGWALAAAGLGSYLLTSNLLFVIGTVTSERLWYWPSVAGCLGLGWLVSRWRDWLGEENQRGSVLTLLMIVVYLMGAAWSYTPAWRTEMSHALRTVQRFPFSWRANVNLAREYYDEKAFKLGIAHARQAAEVFPDMALAWDWIGMNGTFIPKEHASAEAAFRKAIALDPGMKEVRLHLATLLKMQGRLQEALNEVRAVGERSERSSPSQIQDRIRQLEEEIRQSGREPDPDPVPKHLKPVKPNYHKK